jgi:hypothetical protein
VRPIDGRDLTLVQELSVCDLDHAERLRTVESRGNPRTENWNGHYHCIASCSEFNEEGNLHAMHHGRCTKSLSHVIAECYTRERGNETAGMIVIMQPLGMQLIALLQR